MNALTFGNMSKRNDPEGKHKIPQACFHGSLKMWLYQPNNELRRNSAIPKLQVLDLESTAENKNNHFVLSINQVKRTINTKQNQ